MVDLIVKAVTDPLTILALTEFFKKYKTVAIKITLASGYKYKRVLYIEQTDSLYINFKIKFKKETLKREILSF